MNPNYLFICFSLFSLFLFFSPAYAHNKTHPASKKSPQASVSSSSSSSSSSSLQGSFKGSFSAIYAFGDSYTDTGNAQAMGGGGKASSTTTRRCDGRLVLDFLCDALSLPPLPTYKGSTSGDFKFGVNFAIAGSMALTNEDQKRSHSLMWNELTANLQTQIDWFNKYFQEVVSKGQNSSAGRSNLDNALFWVGTIGVNGYARGSWFSNAPLHKLTEMSVFHNCKLIQTLLDKGAKYIVVQGLPPVGCLPQCIFSSPLHDRDKTGCASTINSAVMIHNEILQKKLQDFQRLYPSSTILYADYWNAFITILMNPTKYHFEELFKACCGAGGGKLNFNPKTPCGSKGASTCDNPSKYMNWDGLHFTEAMYRQIADLFLHQGFCRPSFDQLVKKKSGI